jgi:hypothetical protein
MDFSAKSCIVHCDIRMMPQSTINRNYLHSAMQAVTIPNAPHNPATTFVSGLAWTFIGLTAVSVLLAAGLYTLFAYLLPIEPLRAVFTDAISLKLLPPSALKVLEHLPGICIALFAASLLTLLVSIALLQRRNWARIAFAWIMIATAIAHIAGLLLPFYFMHDFSAALNDVPPELRGVATGVTRLLAVVSIVTGIAFAGCFAWLAKQLFSAELARQFVARDNTGHL